MHEFFRNFLNQRIDELRLEAGKTVENMDEDENFPDPSDRASMESNRNSMLRMRDRERKLIFKIQEALQRLNDGEYGICEECGEEIGIERLKARPGDHAVHRVANPAKKSPNEKPRRVV